MKITYPVIIIGAIFFHNFLLKLGFEFLRSVYIPIVISMILIAGLEFLFPFQKKWLPSSRDLKTDTLFLLILQIMLPKFLLLSFVFITLHTGLFNINELSRLWPHGWHPAVQAIILLFMVDFLIYWIHRAFHQFSNLWRFHAVHHFSSKLYWLNVSRDHPLETISLFLFSLSPFYLLGIDDKVFAIYIIVFDIQAFFQHCNIDLKYGMLNYLISSSELHRWHHSRDFSVANHNFGNTFIIWDILFKTKYFPHGNFTKVGLKNHEYPFGFLDQMKAPFVKGLSDISQPLPSYSQLLLQGLQLFVGKTKKK